MRFFSLSVYVCLRVCVHAQAVHELEAYGNCGLPTGLLGRVCASGSGSESLGLRQRSSILCAALPVQLRASSLRTGRLRSRGLFFVRGTKGVHEALSE